MLSLDGTDYAAGTKRLPESGFLNFAGLFAPPVIKWTIRVALPQDQLPGFLSLFPSELEGGGGGQLQMASPRGWMADCTHYFFCPINLDFMT